MKTRILIGSRSGLNLGIRMAFKLFKGGGSLIGDWDYFSQDVNVKETSLFLVLVEKEAFFFSLYVVRTYPCQPYDAYLSELCAFNNF